MNSESILQEAERLINGDRRGSYGHPLDNFTNTADLLNTFLHAKLKTKLTAEDVAMIMVLLKLAREMNAHKRDNLTDAAGYLGCLEKVIDERARRLEIVVAEPIIFTEPPSPANPSGTTPAREGILKARAHININEGNCWCGYPDGMIPTDGSGV